ncbi:hypothetical protein PQQ84_22485 [Paraburkholderia strydomiana]|uniref:hypothetical protein n=1 Tax=Paraburkholderia strydomiana TaxID=1245417 RepID=UPI0038BD6E1F
MTATTSKLGADMLTDEQREQVLSYATHIERTDPTTNGHEVAAAIRALLARQPAAIDKEAVAATVYVDCHECAECGHIGINDSHDTDASCGYSCGWTGPSPVEDKCPGCQREGVMGLACPKCSGRYSTIAEARIPAAPLDREASNPAAPSVEQDERGDAPLSLIPELVKQDQCAVGDALLDMGDAMVAWRTEVGKYREITSLAQSAFSDGYEAGIAAILCARAASTSANVAQGAEAVTSLRRIAHELRTYNPAADEYKGEHIHKVWAREIDAALTAAQSASGDTK